MRKLFAIFLITSIACNSLLEIIENTNENTILDYFELDKENVELNDDLKKFSEMIKKNKKINIEDFVIKLKRIGVWNFILKFAKKYGKSRAKLICEKLTNKYYECEEIVKKYFH